ncbi:MAG: bifunctional oligoribonuclease/PAP phosphatase NrnA [Abditibacteriota bacterium]|nr:bifunctional oligoribonuclease/PAP phosphatase NrnA [Abditibacteriota bacterium]MBP5738337.1 bifunctional oligoribonuclease/PAP phosphatase NrnA [Abditibacteriota bacterium]
MTDLRDIWKGITSAESVAIAFHVSPDGDALGSSLALARILRSMGIRAEVFSQDEVPESYLFMPDVDKVRSDSRDTFDLGILMDCNSLSRVGAVAPIIEACPLHGCIDHHLPNETFGELRYVREKASSAVEVLMDILTANNVEYDADTAKLLMTGLVTDTGVFRFSNVSALTLRYAAALMDHGASAEPVVHYVYESRSLGALKLQGYVLSNIKTACDGKIAWVALSKELLDSFGVGEGETSGVGDHIRKLKGCKAALFMRETEKGKVKVSLRSREDFDVSKPANILGGGGHVCASGCTLDMPIDEAEKVVVAEVARWMDS